MTTFDANITKDDFIQSGWDIVVASCDKKQCHDYSYRFYEKAREAEESGDEKSKAILDLLSGVSSLRLKLDSLQAPFEPMMVSHGHRTTMIDDFDVEHLTFFAEIVPAIGDPELRARIADVLWLRQRDYRMAEEAVASYLESAKVLEDPQHWTKTRDRIERALHIAVLLGRKTNAHAAVIEHIENVLSKYNGEDPLFLSAKLMEFLQERREGDPKRYAALAEKLALSAESTGSWDRAREYWRLKSRWHYIEKDKDLAHQARLLEAETYVKHADSHVNGEHPSYMHASARIQHAIEAFRRIEGTKDRVQDLHATLLDYQQRSTAELIPMSSTVDLTDIAKIAVEQVKGRELSDALIRLAMIGGLPDVEELRKQAKEYREKFLFQKLFPRVYLNAMGRVIARQPVDEEEALMADMFNNVNMSRLTRVHGLVEPARHQILSDHYVRVEDFLSWLFNHPFVPEGREFTIARGLHAGLYGDFLTAAHFLIPQIEASVRYILFQIGVIASGIDEDGIQDEYNLNKMLTASKYTEPLAKRVLGADFVFDLRGLLVERFGSNLRNDMAHGLIDDNAFYLPSGVYLWWLTLRLYSLPVVANLRREKDDAAEQDSNE